MSIRVNQKMYIFAIHYLNTPFTSFYAKLKIHSTTFQVCKQLFNWNFWKVS